MRLVACGDDALDAEVCDTVSEIPSLAGVSGLSEREIETTLGCRLLGLVATLLATADNGVTAAVGDSAFGVGRTLRVFGPLAVVGVDVPAGVLGGRGGKADDSTATGAEIGDALDVASLLDILLELSRGMGSVIFRIPGVFLAGLAAATGTMAGAGVTLDAVSFDAVSFAVSGSGSLGGAVSLLFPFSFFSFLSFAAVVAFGTGGVAFSFTGSLPNAGKSSSWITGAKIWAACDAIVFDNPVLLARVLTSSFACSFAGNLATLGFGTTTAGTGVGVGGTDTVDRGVATRGI
jgi:hypothetical protein